MTEHNETQTEMWLRSSNAELSRQLATAIASEERALAVGDTIVAQFCHGYPYREEHEGSDDGATVFDARGEVFAKMSSLSDAQTLVSIINDACSRAYVCPNGGPTVEPWIIHSTCPLCQK